MVKLWNDPQFQKEFTASYGTLSGYEPNLSEDDKSKLQKLSKHKNTSKQAIKQLSKEINSEDNAAFDLSSPTFISARRFSFS